MKRITMKRITVVATEDIRKKLKAQADSRGMKFSAYLGMILELVSKVNSEKSLDFLTDVKYSEDTEEHPPHNGLGG